MSSISQGLATITRSVTGALLGLASTTTVSSARSVWRSKAISRSASTVR